MNLDIAVNSIDDGWKAQEASSPSMLTTKYPITYAFAMPPKNNGAK